MTMTGLDRYVAASDGEGAWEASASPTLAADGACMHVLQLRSQRWRGIVWGHRLYVWIPAGAEPGTPWWLHLVANGDPDAAWVHLKVLAERVHCPVAMLCDVPNQPLFDGRTEDGLLAYTLDRFLEEIAPAADDWPLLLPMTKAAVRAMNALGEWAAQRRLSVSGYVLSGASKRGWTAYLTAAVDPRVVGLAPRIFDNLNFDLQLRRQAEVYGPESNPQLGGFRRVMETMQPGCERVRQLVELVDPHAYRHRLTQPKCLLLGTNDPYWPVDALRLYRADLLGSTAIVYFPNAGHGLNDPSRLLAALGVLHESVTHGTPLPEVRLDAVVSGGRARVTVRVVPAATGLLRLWHANAVGHDFRSAGWVSTPLGGGGQWVGDWPLLPDRWQAMYAEADVPAPGTGAAIGVDSPIIMVPPGPDRL